MRIESHPILDVKQNSKEVNFSYNGKDMVGKKGEPIMVALLASGIRILRYTHKNHSPRGVFCAIGRCTDCVMIVDGKPNIRTCVTPLEEGMTVKTQYGVSDKDSRVG